uniref:Uncharacterized protein n=1 Tax=Oryza barthii TaxID=65489 RepID=A0A0D3H455_9ORYZ
MATSPLPRWAPTPSPSRPLCRSSDDGGRRGNVGDLLRSPFTAVVAALRGHHAATSGDDTAPSTDTAPPEQQHTAGGGELDAVAAVTPPEAEGNTAGRSAPPKGGAAGSAVVIVIVRASFAPENKGRYPYTVIATEGRGCGSTPRTVPPSPEPLDGGEEVKVAEGKVEEGWEENKMEEKRREKERGKNKNEAEMRCDEEKKNVE